MMVNLVYREIKEKKKKGRRGKVKFVTREDEGIKRAPETVYRQRQTEE